jgi:hypothetical protein
VFEVESSYVRRAAVKGERTPILRQTSVLGGDENENREVTLDNLGEYATLVTHKLLVENPASFIDIVRGFCFFGITCFTPVCVA